MSTITGTTINQTVTVASSSGTSGSGTYGSPLTITSSGAVSVSGNAVVGSILQPAVVNYGTIDSTGGTGIDLTDGGSITNGTSASTAYLIEGSTSGVVITGAAGTIANFGIISGASGRGVYLGGRALAATTVSCPWK